MEPLFALVIATAVSVAIIPLMWRLAPRLGLLDEPDPRKVHTQPIPRVGGLGIVIGALTPAVFLLHDDPLIESYLLGSLVLLAFGLWDDRRTLGHRVKFIGQLIAAALVVFHGGLWIEHAPFIGLGTLPMPVGVALSFFAIVGMINAVNTSDGLDGLAGGESLLSLMVIAFLAYTAEGMETVVLALTAIGGILGFLRFNTHPAQVFMGDSGSQFLGFTLAFLAILLTQRTHPALSPAITLLFLGLPIVDIFSVMGQRLARGMSPFKAARNHIHHRIMDLGFDHHEVVIIIYGIHACFVIAAILLRYEHDWLVTSVYLAGIAALFLMLVHAERSGWRRTSQSRVSAIMASPALRALLARYPYLFVAWTVPLYLVAASLMTSAVPRDFAITSAVLAVLLLVEMLLGRHPITFPIRGAVYVAIVFAAYLAALDQTLGSTGAIEFVFFGMLVVVVGLTVRYAGSVRFQTTPMDYLILAGVVVAAMFGQEHFQVHGVSLLIVKAVLLLYASELMFERTDSRWSLLNIASLLALCVFAWKGLAIQG